jgi:hypothetical protein
LVYDTNYKVKRKIKKKKKDNTYNGVIYNKLIEEYGCHIVALY